MSGCWVDGVRRSTIEEEDGDRRRRSRDDGRARARQLHVDRRRRRLARLVTAEQQAENEVL